jgi:hypothetical protein
MIKNKMMTLILGMIALSTALSPALASAAAVKVKKVQLGCLCDCIGKSPDGFRASEEQFILDKDATDDYCAKKTGLSCTLDDIEGTGKFFDCKQSSQTVTEKALAAIPVLNGGVTTAATVK